MRLKIPKEATEQLLIDENSPSNLAWKIDKGPRARKGTKAGCLNKKTNYYYVRLNDKLYLAHRLVWFLYYGVDPGEFQIDHIDRNRTNNSVSNLRKATQTEQNHNSCKKSTNKSGYKGVRKHVHGK